MFLKAEFALKDIQFYVVKKMIIFSLSFYQILTHFMKSRGKN